MTTGEAHHVSDDLMGRRHQVPSPRESGIGEVLDSYDFVVEKPEATQRESARALILRYVRDADPRKIDGPKRPLLIIGLISLLTTWDDQVLGVLGPEIRAELGVSVATLAALASIIGIITIGLGPIGGFLADRVKRVWLVRFGGIIGNAATVLFAMTPNVGGMFASRLLGGIGGSLSAPASYPLLCDYYPARARARVFAFFGLMGAIGGLAGPALAGTLAEQVGWRLAAGALGVFSVIVTLLLFLLREPVRGYLDRRDMGVSEEEAMVEPKPLGWAESWRAARSITTLRLQWYAIPFQVISSTGLTLLIALYYAQVFALSPSQRGFLTSFGAGMGIIFLVFAGPVADRLLQERPAKIVLFQTVLLFVGAGVTIVLALSRNLVLSVVVGLPISFFSVALAFARIHLQSLVIPPRLRGLGLQAGAPFAVIGLVATPFVVAIAEKVGIRQGLMLFVPLQLIGAAIIGATVTGIERDIRAARAAGLADEEARRARAEGRNKMIVCRDVDVTYGSVQVLFGVDFDVEEGELVALMGTNGAGKSTLLRAICGVQEASNGAVFLDGRDITHAPPYINAADGIVMVPGGHAVFPSLTVAENLRAAAWLYREDEEYVASKTEEVLDFFPVLRDRLATTAGDLSGGEQQMIALGQAFLMRPRLLMIDELSLGLAPAIVERLLDTLRTMHAAGTTIVLVEQSLNVALTIAERAVFMEKGEIRFDGSTADLLARPDLVRAVFMGGAVGGGGSSMAAKGRRDSLGEREVALEVRHVGVAFGGVQALSDVSLDVKAGEVVGIIGPNGAGKTTLFDVISGFVTPDLGEVRLGATDVTGWGPDARARIGLSRSFQNALLFPSITVRENIAVAMERQVKARSPLLAATWSRSVRRQEHKVERRVDALIELLGLGAYADKFVGELSTGTRRTVDIACIMAAEPDVLLLDEPAAGLAQAETEALGPVLTRLVRESGFGLLVIEHDLPLVTSISDRMVAMELGSVLVVGSPTDVAQDPRVLASYLGASNDTIQRSGPGRMGALAAALTSDNETTNEEM